MTKLGRKGINYNDVVLACKELEGQNEVISIRKVLAITGGSFSTISEHIRKWQEAQANLIKSKALPDEVLEGLKVAYVKMFENERKIHQMAIVQERKILDEYLKKIIDLEALEDKLTKEAIQFKQHFDSTVGGYERKFAAAESRLVDAEKREKDLNKKIDLLQEQLKQAEIIKAVAESHADEYRKQLDLKNKKPGKT